MTETEMQYYFDVLGKISRNSINLINVMNMTRPQAYQEGPDKLLRFPRLRLHLFPAKLAALCMASAILAIGNSVLVLIPHVFCGLEYGELLADCFGLRSAGFADAPPVAVYAPNCSMSFVRRFIARNIRTFKNTMHPVGI